MKRTIQTTLNVKVRQQNLAPLIITYLSFSRETEQRTEFQLLRNWLLSWSPCLLLGNDEDHTWNRFILGLLFKILLQLHLYTSELLHSFITLPTIMHRVQNHTHKHTVVSVRANATSILTVLRIRKSSTTAILKDREQTVTQSHTHDCVNPMVVASACPAADN